MFTEDPNAFVDQSTGNVMTKLGDDGSYSVVTEVIEKDGKLYTQRSQNQSSSAPELNATVSSVVIKG